MARMKKNLYLQGSSGTLGGQLVYKTVDGQMVVSVTPSRVKPPSEKQKQQNKRFKYASIFAKKVMENDELGKIYTDAAKRIKRFKSGYQVALTDYLRSPEIGDLTVPSQTAGSVLLVEAFEDPQVKSVTFYVLDTNGEVVENDSGSPHENGIQWMYTLKNNLSADMKVKVEAYDIPGNMSNQTFDV